MAALHGQQNSFEGEDGAEYTLLQSLCSTTVQLAACLAFLSLVAPDILANKSLPYDISKLTVSGPVKGVNPT